MSWLGRQFARKAGGTRIGNMIRQLAYDNIAIVDEHFLGQNVRDMTPEEKIKNINPGM